MTGLTGQRGCAHQLILIGSYSCEDCLGEDPGLVFVLVNISDYHRSRPIHQH